jgi:hypothetical protein
MIALAPSRENFGRFFTLLGILAVVIIALYFLQDRSQPAPNSPEAVI